MWRDSWYLSSCFYAFDCSWNIFHTIVARFLHFAGWQRARRRRPIDSPNNRTTYHSTRRGLHDDTVTLKLERHQAALSTTIWLAVFLMMPPAWLLFPAAFFFFSQTSQYFTYYGAISQVAWLTQPLQKHRHHLHHHQQWVTTSRMYVRANIRVGNILTSAWRHRS